MQTELFSQLESKLETLIEEVETLRLEVSELRETRDSLQAEQEQSESRVKALLNKFDRLADSADL